MSVETMPGSKLTQDTVVQPESAVIPDLRQLKENALAELQEDYGPDIIVTDCEAATYNVFRGPASDKVWCGSFLGTEVSVLESDGAKKHIQEIDGNNRPYSEESIALLGRLAEVAGPEKSRRRDLPLN